MANTYITDQKKETKYIFSLPQALITLCRPYTKEKKPTYFILLSRNKDSYSASPVLNYSTAFLSFWPLNLRSQVKSQLILHAFHALL